MKSGALLIYWNDVARSRLYLVPASRRLIATEPSGRIGLSQLVVEQKLQRIHLENPEYLTVI